MTEPLSAETREAVVDYVLSEVHPDRLEGEVAGVRSTDEGLLVGVKVHPRGYISTAKYALVTVDETGQVRDAQACTGRELRRELDESAGQSSMDSE